MNLRLQIATLLLLVAATALHAQTESPTPQKPASTTSDVAYPVAHTRPKPRPANPTVPLFNMDAIVLDPAHGGSDNGARISDGILEKDVNLAFANRLKSLLIPHGFSVLLTRTADPSDLTPDQRIDQRIELANRSHAVACILIHASNGGHGVHIFTSSLNALSDLEYSADEPRPITPWDTAQAASIPNSLRLAADLSTAFNNIRIPLVTGRASVSPIDSMTCPAIALELAPLASGDGETLPSDPAYQQRVAEAVAAALVFWRTHAQSISDAAQGLQHATPSTTTPAIKKPKPKPVTPPIEVPDEPGPATAPHQPAPIIRKPPPPPPGAQR